jgi:transcriptional repressor NrdR
VLETRRVDGSIRRRRECAGCGRRFTTWERSERGSLAVRKRSGERQPFDRVKLRAGLLRASHKRPVDPVRIEALVEGIESEAERAGGELPAQRIGEMCLDGLRDLDRVAYLQFAAVYKEFDDIEQVQAELAELRSAPRTQRDSLFDTTPDFAASQATGSVRAVEDPA